MSPLWNCTLPFTTKVRIWGKKKIVMVMTPIRTFFSLSKAIRLKSFLKANSPKTVSHCAFSSNLFHRQIAQIYIDHLNGPENKKCRPWKVFGTNHPQTLLLLSRRGPRSLGARLSQHYIGPKMTFRHFSNFCRKKFPGLTKRLLHIFIQFWGL